MKLLKILFNRFTYISLAILLQMGLYLILALSLYTYYWIINIMSYIGAVIIIIRVLNRDINPGQKILWCTVLALVPIMGATIYFLIGDAKWSNAAKRRMRKTFYKQVPTVNATEDIPKKYIGQVNYLKNKAGTNSYRGNDTVFFSTGEKYFESLKKDLSSAKKFIFMEFFIINKGHMWGEIEKILSEKVAAGVEVRVMYDDIGSIWKLSGNFYKTLKKKGINCIRFNTFTPFVTNLHNNRDHRKIVVIDGVIGYTGGINLADEYINADGRSYYWKDCGLRISGNAVGELTEQFMQLFEIADKKPIDFENYVCRDVIDGGEEGVVVPFGTGPYFFYRCPLAEEVLLNAINQAEREIFISTPYLIPDYSLDRALASAAARGVNVKIAIPDIPDKKPIYLITRNNALYLKKNGVKIYRAKGSFLHSKVLAADGEVAIVGTINFDYRSLIHHFENAVWMYGTNAVRGAVKDMNDICSDANEFGEDIDPGFWARLAANIMELFAPLF